MRQVRAYAQLSILSLLIGSVSAQGLVASPVVSSVRISPTVDGDLKIGCRVVDTHDGVNAVWVWMRSDDDSFLPIAMHFAGKDIWDCTLDLADDTRELQYYIWARNGAGAEVVHPRQAPGDHLSAWLPAIIHREPPRIASPPAF